MIYSYDFEHRVGYVEVDKMGIVHNSNYFVFFEIGRTETIRSLGVSYDQMEKQGMMMPLIDQYAKYIKPALYDDLLTIRTIINEMPSSRFVFNYQILRKEEDGNHTLLCEGYNSLAFVDIPIKRIHRCPLWLRELLEKVR